MSEYRLQVRVILKMLLVVALASLYAFGGIEHKELRRFVAPTIFTLFALIYTMNWKSLIYLLIIPSMCMGYGGDYVAEKIFRRATFGLVNGISTASYSAINKQILLAVTQIILVTALYIIIGVWNPLPNARTEEFFLGIMCYLIPTLSLKRKGE